MTTTIAMAAPRTLLVSVLVVVLVVSVLPGGAGAATFTFLNSCPFTVWVGLQPNGGLPLLADGGFQVLQGAQQVVTAPPGWGGRFWGRTGCVFDATGMGVCETGDCGGALKCNGAGGTPPASLAEITLNGANNDDFYDVSLVDGYNLPIAMNPLGGTGTCGAPGCVSNLNLNCPTPLQVLLANAVVGCRSACAAFGAAQYCCTGAYGSPTTCQPTQYSLPFKAACPTAYSYAYDDATSTFTCQAPSYVITFCPAGAA